MLSRAAIYALTPQGARLAFEIARQIRLRGLPEQTVSANPACCNVLTGRAKPQGTLDTSECSNRENERAGSASRVFDGQIFLSASLKGPASNGLDPGCAPVPPENAANVCVPAFFERIGQQLAENFREFSCHILICATGIAVRSLAPLLGGKEKDPAVLVLDQQGRFVISLLSGHIGGANRAALELAEAIGATPVITTATDCEDLPALDELAARRNLRIENLEAVRKVNSALLKGEEVWLWDVENLLGLRGSRHEKLFTLPSSLTTSRLKTDNAPPGKLSSAPAGNLPGNSGSFQQFLSEIGKKRKKTEENGKAAIFVDPPIQLTGLYEYFAEHALDAPPVLILRSKTLWLGLGCRRGSDPHELERFTGEALRVRGLDWADLAGVASIDIKQDEEAILQLARRHRLPLRFFTAAELDRVPAPSPSGRVKEATGTSSVCEAAAMLAAGFMTEGAAPWAGELLLQKLKGTGMTVAIAASRAGCHTIVQSK